MDITQKRQLLDSFGGKFFKAVWKVKSGEVREANCKRFIHAAFTDGHASLAKENPVGHKPEYFSACDMDKNEKWVNISLETLIHVKCGDIDITF